jgi:hypothetical protein
MWRWERMLCGSSSGERRTRRRKKLWFVGGEKMDGGGAPKGGIKISFIVLGACIFICLGCYFYGSWSDAQAEQAMVPWLHADSMVKDLRKYQKLTGQFPDNLSEMEGKVWHHQPAPDFGADKRRLTAFNYYYVYSKVDPLTCAVWAIPSGPKRDEGSSTYFLVVGLDVIRNWKGPSLAKTDIEKLRPVPTNDELKVMGLTEQPIIDQRSGGNKSAAAVQKN